MEALGQSAYCATGWEAPLSGGRSDIMICLDMIKNYNELANIDN